MSKNLKNDFISGIKWTGLSKFGAQGVQLLTTFILARLLSPSDFGLLGLANVFLAIANHINQMGISAAIVQKKDMDEGYLSSAFWANIFFGLFLTVFVFFLSWPAASFFNIKELRFIMQTLSLIYFLGSLRIVHGALFGKKLEFRKLAIVEIISIIVSGVTSISLALNGFGVWSLVYGQLANSVVSTVLVWILSAWRPKILFDTVKFKQLFTFGFNVMGTNLLASVSGNLAPAVIGKFLDVVSVGMYNMSLNIIYFPARLSTMLFSPVMFPVFSRIQNDDERFNKAYFKILRTITILTFPALIGMVCVAPEFVKVVLGEKWIAVINPIRLLFVVGMIDSLVATVGSVFCSKGRPDIELRADFVLFLAFFPMIFVGIKFGLTGVIIATMMHRVISITLFFSFMKPLIHYRIKSLFSALFPALRDSLVMGLTVSVYRAAYQHFFDNDFILLVSSVAVGATVYLSCLKLINSETYLELKHIVQDSLKFKKLSDRKEECFNVTS